MNPRDWMYDRWLPNRDGWKQKFLDGVEEFITYATSQVDLMDGGKIKCPCSTCKNGRFRDIDKVRTHLYRQGFVDNYLLWNSHGEKQTVCTSTYEEPSSSHYNDMGSFGIGASLFDNLNPTQRMVFDAAGPSFVPPPWFGPNTSAPEPSTSQVPFENSEHIEEESNMAQQASTIFGHENDDISFLSERFSDVLRAADQPLYHGSHISQLAAVGSFMELKTKYNMSQAGYSALLQKVSNVLPSDNNLPKSYYEQKKMTRELGLPQQKIHLCPNGCMLFWKEYEDYTECVFCKSPRYKACLSQKGKPIPNKVLRYLPLTPRLQRLYAMKETASKMRWHALHQADEGFMSHPSDAEAWKHFDRTFPDFASEVRNVRLCLCSDGFSPFGKFGRSYSTWPVIVTPYNLPPEMCMQTRYLFLSTIVPGPKNPKKLIDVCMQPLIDELVMLWTEGVPTFDVSTGKHFRMRAALMWTVSDFPAHGMLSGWSTAGIYSCPYCMYRTKSFRLQHGRKPSWFDCHRCLLPRNHTFRKDKKNFYKGRAEKDPPIPYLSGQQMWECVKDLPTAMESPCHDPDGYGETHKFTKQSIFWKLPYWKYHLLRHNLDVMHIEKNVFENVINTVLDDKGKTKDNLNSRKDLRLYCHRPELQVEDDHKGPKPKALYTLTKLQKMELLTWLKTLRFPDGYVSNIGRCVQLQDGKLLGMKSHDCHVFMQRLLPIAFKELLPTGVWGTLAELSLFFQAVCSSTLDKQCIEKLERDVPLLLCQLERIFPPSFFDSMEHLIVHLPYEALLAGPVQYRWMYVFERFLFILKGNMLNPQKVEASIVESYLFEEITNFSQNYREPQDLCKRRKGMAYDSNVTCETYPQVSIFNHPGRASGTCKVLWMTNGVDFEVAHTYILLNCREVDSYRQTFQDTEGQGDPYALAKRFSSWFSDYVLVKQNLHPPEVDHDLIRSLAWGPSKKVISWPTYSINGYKYETLKRGEGKLTMNSGVCVQAFNGEEQSDFFGLIEQIYEFEFTGLPCKKIVLFKCLWFDPSVNGTRVHPQYNFQEINWKRRYNNHDPFVFAQQCIQVYYADYPGVCRSRADWKFVCKTKPRARVQQHWTETPENVSESMDSDPLQADDIEVDGFVGSSIESLPVNLNDPTSVDEDMFDEVECSEEDSEVELGDSEDDIISDSSNE